MKQCIQRGARFALVVLFVVAGLPKIAAPQDFALVVFRYHLLPASLINATALLFPWTEGFAALSLLLPLWRRAGVLWLTSMLLVGAVAVAISLARGLDIDCGCFTLQPGRSPIGLWNILRNALLIVALFWAGWREGAPGPEPSG